MIKKKFKKISIKLTSPRKILFWSYGEVKTSEYINYKNLKPKKNGLFCLKIFSEYDLCCNKNKCVCNKYDKFLNLKKSHLSYRMGHIKLNYPIAHIWFLKSIPNGITNITGLSYKIIEKIINFKIRIVVRSYQKNIKKYHLVNSINNNKIYSMNGAKALKKILSNKELLIECYMINKIIENCDSYFKLFEFLDKINKIYIFYISGNKPDWLFLDFLPVIPPKIRPLVPLSINKFAISDINELYKKILDRNYRLKKMVNMGSPRQIISNERILLQEAVSALFDNEKLSNPIVSSSKRVLKSFSNSIKGKYGRFRQNLLGKRVDFSGRTVITVEPNIFFYQCVLPIYIAIELFKPFIYYELKKQNIFVTISLLEFYFKKHKFFIIKILKNIVKNFTIILNRAPTLHRMGFQSFKILLSEEKSIKLHPLMCLSYNADFDGDQMAVHLPLTIFSQIESEVLLLSINNIISPSNGDPIIIPTQDIVMGIYLLTLNININTKKILSLKKVLNNFTLNNCYKENIFLYYKNKLIKTTVGRVIFYFIFDEIDFNSFNKIFKKKDLIYLIKYIIEFYSIKILIKILEKIKKIGFFYITFFGLTLNYNDLHDIKKKYFINKIFKKLIFKNNIFEIIEIFNNIFLNIIIKKICTRTVNNLFVMLDSGSRGSIVQIKQLILFRGFISKSNGDIILDPIFDNLKNGLSMKNYFISTFGARKGLTDTSLKTANSGYLTRKLVDVTNDVIIYKINCMTKIGIEFLLNTTLEKIYKKIYGRVILKNVLFKNKIFIRENTLINNKIIFLLLKINIKKIIIRNIIHCISIRGVCQYCYGIDLSTIKIVSIGTPVGIISAQSIGEPGTQLTMRTFHTGGVVNFSFIKNTLIINSSGFINLVNCKCVLNYENNIIVVSISSYFKIRYKNNIEFYKLFYGSILSYRNLTFVKKKNKLLEYCDDNFYIYSENYGYIFYKTSFVIKEFCFEDNKFYFKTTKSIFIKIIGKITKNYILPKNFLILFNIGKYVLPGFKISKSVTKNIIKSDIIGGLPRLSEIFESRLLKNKAIVSEIDGIININYDKNDQYLITIFSKYGFNKTYSINFNRKIFVNTGDFVKKGEILTDGKPELNDLINLINIDYLLFFFINEINLIYNPQGIYINDKHIEIVLRQMLKKVKIIYSGDCMFKENDIILYEDVLIENYNTLKKNKKVCLYERIVTGITKSALESQSFFSAASFQETSKILIDSAIRNRTDYLLGLKENVLVGKLIPAGTGLINYFYFFSEKGKNLNDIIKKKNLRLYIY